MKIACTRSKCWHVCVCRANNKRIWTEKRNQRLLLENLLKYTMLNRFEPWNRRIVFKMRMVANVAAVPVNGRMLTFYSAEICIESRIKHWYTYAYLLVIFVYTSKTKYENVSIQNSGKRYFGYLCRYWDRKKAAIPKFSINCVRGRLQMFDNTSGKAKSWNLQFSFFAMPFYRQELLPEDYKCASLIWA